MVPVKDSRAIATLRRMHQLMSKVNAGHDLQEVLQTVAEGVADVVGFQVACIRQLRSDNTLEVVAVAGDDHARESCWATESRSRPCSASSRSPTSGATCGSCRTNVWKKAWTASAGCRT